MRKPVLLAAFTLASFALAAETPAAKRPNFLVIVADDLGYADVGFQGSRQIKTPDIDRLAAGGVVFTQGYVSSVACAPSRAGLLTGRYQNRFGYEYNPGVNEPGYDPAAKGLTVGQKTVGDRLRERGYATGLIGKWHLGSLPQFLPQNRGFSEFTGFLAGGRSYFPDKAVDENPESALVSNRGETAPVTYLTDDLGDACVDFVTRHTGEPFCLFAMFNAPHTPMHATEADLKPYSNIPDKRRRTYCAMVAALDRNVGKLLDVLDKQGLANDTVVVFLSDNGGPPLSNGSCNAPLDGSKGGTMEGGIRVPFTMRWPARLKPGRYDLPVIALDLTPTFVKLAGGEIAPGDEFDGVDLLPYLSGEKSDRPHPTLYWKFGVSAAIREGDTKLVRVQDRLPMVFNLGEDTSERHDLMKQDFDRTGALLKKLSRWELQNPYPRFIGERHYRQHDLDLYDTKFFLTQPGPDEVPQAVGPEKPASRP